MPIRLNREVNEEFHKCSTLTTGCTEEHFLSKLNIFLLVIKCVRYCIVSFFFNIFCDYLTFFTVILKVKTGPTEDYPYIKDNLANSCRERRFFKTILISCEVQLLDSNSSCNKCLLGHVYTTETNRNQNEDHK